MDRKVLTLLNELQYSEEEINQLEGEVDKNSHEFDKYYVKNSKVLRKLTIEMAKEKIENELEKNENVEHQLFADQGMYGNTNMIPSGMTGDTAVYYFITLTNKRLYIRGYNQFYKPLENIVKEFHEIKQVTEAQSIRDLPYVILPEDQKDKNISSIELDERMIELATTDDVIQLIKGIEKKQYPK